MKISVIGMDPSLSNWGFVKAEVDADTKKVTGQSLYLQKTATGKNKKTVRKNSDDLSRARDLADAIRSQIDGAAVAFVEVPVGSQSARAMASYGICIGLLASMQIPMIQVSPDEVKLAGAGHKTASKEEQIVWAVADQPELKWLTRKVKGELQITNTNEHLADALAAIYAGLKTEDFQSVLAILRMTR
ncbi:conserved hypothetical protein [Vibrio coralliirubri]|uniref:hypothetical protein n=1 Tax=Vibrio coralliirubri TaxID=1516159 RepID=UPI000633994D|nr:hypothetical protein [Vibrio coralliirubri]CDT53475.1 conserved hypothetical protein [Vibrio coralliirubri]